jgi:Flp pilus assembly pilin Flp
MNQSRLPHSAWIGSLPRKAQKESVMAELLRVLWCADEGQDIAEYAVMLAVILVIVIGTVRLIGGNANNVFSSVASQVGQ